MLALKVLAALEKDAPADLMKRVLDDQTKDCYLRLEARYTLQSEYSRCDDQAAPGTASRSSLARST